MIYLGMLYQVKTLTIIFAKCFDTVRSMVPFTAEHIIRVCMIETDQFRTWFIKVYKLLI